MGQTIKELYKKKLTGRSIFPRRFVIEVCEEFHVHIRNLRLLLDTTDFLNIAEGFKSALDRWNKRGKPQPSAKNHIELCRKKVAEDGMEFKINLNKNLYNHHEGMVFSDGAEFSEENYVHFKLGDIRVELTIDQFKEVADGCDRAVKSIGGVKQYA